METKGKRYKKQLSVYNALIPLQIQNNNLELQTLGNILAEEASFLPDPGVFQYAPRVYPVALMEGHITMCLCLCIRQLSTERKVEPFGGIKPFRPVRFYIHSNHHKAKVIKCSCP